MTQPGGPPPSGRYPRVPGSPPPSAGFAAVPPPSDPGLASGRFRAVGARGARLGIYEVQEEVARGGGGVVLRARGPDGRDVAIKVLRQASDAAAERFARERALQSELGLAEGFVPLLAAGDGPTGPWLAMPFLAGGTLRDRLRRGPLPVDEAVDVLRRLAEALGRAHARGIVHRDLKPENVLFTAEGVPLVADLGLAKREGATPSGMSLSVTGEFRGTAGYMAPEQMKDAKTAGPPADVFALGAILYECLAGEPAFAGDSVVAVIEHVDTGRVVPLAKRRPDAPRWLVNVVARSLTRDVDERFPDGAALAAALAAGPAGETRSAGAGLPRLHVASLALGLAVGVALGFAGGAAWRGPGAPGASPQGGGPPVATGTPTPTETPVVVAPPPPVEPPPVESPPVEPPPPVVEPTPPAGPHHRGRASRGGPALGGAAIDMDLGASKRFEVVTRWGSARLRHTAGVNAIDVASGADLMVSGDDHGQVRVWLRTTGQQRYSPLSLGGAVQALALSPDGGRVAFVGPDGKAHARTFEPEQTIDLETGGAATQAMAWSPDGAVLITTCADQTMNVWDLASRTLLGRTKYDVVVTAVAVSADGRTGLVGTETGTLVAYDAATDRGTWRHRSGISCGTLPIRRVAVSADGRRAAGLIPGRGLAVWDVEANEGTVFEDLLRGEPRDLAFAPDGKTVVGVDAESVVAFDCAGRTLISQARFDAPLRAAAVSASEPMRVVFSSARGSGLAWIDVGARTLDPPTGHYGWVTSLVPHGPTLLTCSADGTVRRWTDPDQTEVLLDRDGWINDLELASGGRLLAAAWGHASRPQGGVIVVDLTTNQGVLNSEGAVQVMAATFAADGRSVLSADGPGMVDRVELGTARSQPWRAHAATIRWVRRLDDGRFVTTGTEGPDVVSGALWPPGGGPEPLRRTTLPPHRGIALVPGGGATVVLGGDDGSLTWWDLEAGHEVRRVERAHAGMVGAVALSPDGRLGASGAGDRTLRLWDARDGRELERLALTGSGDLVTSLRFDGQDLYVGLATGVVVLLHPRD